MAQIGPVTAAGSPIGVFTQLRQIALNAYDRTVGPLPDDITVHLDAGYDDAGHGSCKTRDLLTERCHYGGCRS